MASSAGVAPRQWPVMDLLEEQGGISGPKTAVMAAASAASFFQVPVPWALI